MKAVLVGSAAAAAHFPDWRDVKDLDFFTDRDKKELRDEIKHHYAMHGESFYHPDLEQWNWGEVATVDELYTLKVSHMFWPNRWVKHAKDVIEFQKRGAVFIHELYEILYPIWEEHYGKKRAYLPKGATAEDFFTSTVDRVFEHDSIHASVAYYDEPLFNRVLQDGEAVAVSWKKFEALPEDVKMQLCREEIYATALERKIIPSDYRENSLRAYRWALQQTITSFWKGRWALWMVLHLDELQLPDVDYVQVHHNNKERLILL